MMSRDTSDRPHAGIGPKYLHLQMATVTLAQLYNTIAFFTSDTHAKTRNNGPYTTHGTVGPLLYSKRVIKRDKKGFCLGAPHAFPPELSTGKKSSTHTEILVMQKGLFLNPFCKRTGAVAMKKGAVFTFS